MPRGHLYGIGVGPGDPELMSVKADRLIRSTTTVAYFAAKGRPSNARRVAEHLLTDDHREIRIEYPVTVEVLRPDQSYEDLLIECYDEAAQRVAAVLDAGDDVAVICEGDPFFYGSYMYLHNRLAERYGTTVVPGISSPVAGSAALSRPLVCGTEIVSVLSAVLPDDELKSALAACDAAVIIKVGRNLAKVRSVVAGVGLGDRAFYVERATWSEQATAPLAEAPESGAPYFSMVVIPSATACNR
ncbi:MAG TPA: precorrin-2 C(20)-methyltransferase [Acidimicrobiales bacterium]|nr:precorrin-2 C(20)-methyltransferase [Acidimicrobiales bacterium]